MSSKVEKILDTIMRDALAEINEILGYEYLEKAKIEETSMRFLDFMPFVERVLKEKRGVTLEDLEKESYDYKKVKKAALMGMLHGLILREYEGNTFDEKFRNYLYSSGIENCEWITKTEYVTYYKMLIKNLSSAASNINMIKLVNGFIEREGKSIVQAITKIRTKGKFFEDPSTMDEIIVDEHLEIFRELGAIAESYLKLIYAIKYDFSTIKDLDKLQTTDFYKVWKDLKEDSNFSMFTKPFPNTIYWNASKHNKCKKIVNSNAIEFRSNNGTRILSYCDFISLVRELYACTLVLTKINLVIRVRSYSEEQG